MTFGSFARNLSFMGAGFALLASATPALPQDGNDEARLRRLEAEVRALQRKVFPGGDGRFFEPEISAQPTVRSTVTNPSTSAVTDILARLDALEAQLQRQTALNEENGNTIRLLTQRIDALEGAKSANAVVEATPKATAPASSGTSRSVATAKPAGPSAERLAAVQAIAKPQTDDPGDDEYSYGFRLWDAGFYPEAQQQLTLFVENNPKHWRTTYGRNLLGRAYLDDGKAKEAAPWFLKNYQEDKTGARAGDSLLYLAESMIALKDTRRACIALAEFSETYPALAAGRLQSQYEATRGKVKCN
ncbi:tol-pal system YbgF family protein [Qipengyuania sp.]|uniref:tetratricopeptide repeat protein n=1 Tax=Qipengyuania sp. TaxID=2004515 RepID=UPI003513893F